MPLSGASFEGEGRYLDSQSHYLPPLGAGKCEYMYVIHITLETAT